MEYVRPILDLCSPRRCCAIIVLSVITCSAIMSLVIANRSIGGEYRKSLQYKPTICKIKSALNLGPVECQYCTGTTSTKKKDKKCRMSESPCMEVEVSYINTYGRNVSAQLVTTTVLKGDPMADCIFFSCTSSYNTSTTTTNIKIQKYKNMRSFPCFHNPEDDYRILLERVVNTFVYNMSYAIPGGIIGVCALAYIYIIYKIYKETNVRRSQSDPPTLTSHEPYEMVSV